MLEIQPDLLDKLIDHSMILCTICSSDKTARKHGIEAYNIYECKNCMNAFTYPPPPLPKYEEENFHSRASNSSLVSLETLPIDWRALIQAQVDFVETYLPKGATILEIGCGEGILLSELSDKGFKVVGIEPSRSATLRGQSKGLDIMEGYFQDIELYQKVDLIIMSHVLEHILDLDIFLEKINGTLQKGFFMLTQTNYKGLIPRVQRKKWYAWVPDHHYYHFTLTGLRNLLHNYDLVDHIYTPLVHPHNALYHIANMRKNWIDQFISLFQQR